MYARKQPLLLCVLCGCKCTLPSASQKKSCEVSIITKKALVLSGALWHEIITFQQKKRVVTIKPANQYFLCHEWSHREDISCTSPKSPNQDKLGIDVKCIRCHTFIVAKLLCNNICNGHRFLILISALLLMITWNIYGTSSWGHRFT